MLYTVYTTHDIPLGRGSGRASEVLSLPSLPGRSKLLMALATAAKEVGRPRLVDGGCQALKRAFATRILEDYISYRILGEIRYFDYLFSISFRATWETVGLVPLTWIQAHSNPDVRIFPFRKSGFNKQLQLWNHQWLFFQNFHKFLFSTQFLSDSSSRLCGGTARAGQLGFAMEWSRELNDFLCSVPSECLGTCDILSGYLGLVHL